MEDTNIAKEVAGMLMALAFMFCYVPQIVKIFKTKSSNDVSLMLILMSIVGYISGLVYMFLSTFYIWLLLNYIIGLVMCSILVYAWFKYNKKDS